MLPREYLYIHSAQFQTLGHPGRDFVVLSTLEIHF